MANTRFFDFLESISPAFQEGVPSTPPKHVFPFIWHYTRPFAFLILLCTLLSIAVAVLEVYVFSFIGNLVDWLAENEPAVFFAQHHQQLFFYSLLIILILPTLKFLNEAILHQGVVSNFAMRTRWLIHRYLLRQGVDFFQDEFAGRIAAKMMQTTIAIQEIVVKTVEVLAYILVYFGTAIILFAYNDLMLAIPMLLWLVGYVFTIYYFLPRLREVSTEQANTRSMVTGRIVDSYTNITTIKMFSSSRQESVYIKDDMQSYLNAEYQQMRLSTLLSTALVSLNALLIFGTAAVAIWLWSLNLITTGIIAFTVALVMRLQGMAQWILWEVAGLFANIGIIIDGIDTISRRISVVDSHNAKQLSLSHGEIIFDNISFNYGAQDRAAVLDKFTLKIDGGEKIGIVGSSGSGKSTLVNLLMRFYDIQEGQILIDGQDISTVSQESLRVQLGMVTQDTSLLHRSIIDNIRYGNPQITEDEIKLAAKQAHADEFILELEDKEGNTGYQAEVGERGIRLSGGQRQRIGIARVLVRNAPILILDEATSALDSETEGRIQDSFSHLMKNKTVIAIAHRLSTIASMDRLIVMDEGRIVEQGTHQHLLEIGGHYANLWHHQSGGFLSID